MCIKLIRPNCWVSHHWPVGCIKRVENCINITKQCIHKAAGSRINEMIFSSFSWRYLMFIIYETGLEKYFAWCTVSTPIYSCVRQKILCILRIYVRLFLHCILLFVNWVSVAFIVFLQHTTWIVLLCGMFFTKNPLR